MTKDRIAAIRAEIAAATEGPWTAEDDGNMNSMKYRIVQYHADRIRREQGIVTSARHQYHALVKTKEDAQLIARAPYNLKALTDEVESLQAEVEMLRGVGCSEDGDGPCGVCRKCAFKKGAEAMREAVVDVLETHDPDNCGWGILNLPDPEYKP